jgi:hypothetical protein
MREVHPGHTFRSGLLVLTLAAVGFAADPLVGTWKLDVMSSKYPPGARPPKELTEIYAERDSTTMAFTANRVSATGVSSSGTILWPLGGGIVQDPDRTQPQGRMIVQILLRPGEWWTVFLMNGVQARLLHKKVSNDGRTLTQTETATDAQGSPIEQVQVYHRQ